jgi:hypothetical protein
MAGDLQSVVFHPVQADPNPQPKPSVREQIDVRRLFQQQHGLALRQENRARCQPDRFDYAGEIGVDDQRLMEEIGVLKRAGQLRFAAGMLGAEDMVADRDTIVAQASAACANALNAPISPPNSICGKTTPAFMTRFPFDAENRPAGTSRLSWGQGIGRLGRSAIGWPSGATNGCAVRAFKALGASEAAPGSVRQPDRQAFSRAGPCPSDRARHRAGRPIR